MTLPDGNGIQILDCLRKQVFSPPIYSLVITALTDEKNIAMYKSLGAHGYVSKCSPPNEIIDALHKVSSGQQHFPSLSNAVLDEKDALLYSLTTRQRDVIDLLLAGYSNKNIASKLNLSYGTVKNYIFHLMRLLDVNSRLELVLQIQQSGYGNNRQESDALGRQSDEDNEQVCWDGCA